MPVSLCFGGYFVEISDVFWFKDLMFFSETSDVFSLPISSSFGCYSLPVSFCFGGYFVEIFDVFWSKDLMFFLKLLMSFTEAFRLRPAPRPPAGTAPQFPSAKALNGAPFARAGPTSGPGAPMRVNPRMEPLLRCWQQWPAPGCLLF